MEDIGGRLEQEVASWEGVSTRPHRLGGIEFRLGKRQLGHLHRCSEGAGAGDGAMASSRLGEQRARVDLPFHPTVRNMLVETGRALPHHVLPDSGWVTRPIANEEDVGEAIELFRLSYERARVAEARRAAG